MPPPARLCRCAVPALALALAVAPAASVASAEGVGAMTVGKSEEKIDSRALRTPRPGFPLVIAHRGYSEKYTDNSRDSFEAAIAAGADMIETDIRESKDGVLVCVHDREVEGDDVADLTSKQLQMKGVLRLADVLAIAKGRIGVLLDIKLGDAEFPLRIHEAVKRAGMEYAVIFGLRRNSQVRALRAKAPEVTILGFLRNYRSFPRFFAVGGDIARLWEEDVSPANLALARGGNHPVFVTAGHRQSGESPGSITALRFRALTNGGIDGVLVNDPVLALAARSKARK